MTKLYHNSHSTSWSIRKQIFDYAMLHFLPDSVFMFVWWWIKIVFFCAGFHHTWWFTDVWFTSEFADGQDFGYRTRGSASSIHAGHAGNDWQHLSLLNVWTSMAVNADVSNWLKRKHKQFFEKKVDDMLVSCCCFIQAGVCCNFLSTFIHLVSGRMCTFFDRGHSGYQFFGIVLFSCLLLWMLVRPNTKKKMFSIFLCCNR